MVWYGVDKKDIKPQVKNTEKELLNKAINNMKKFLQDPKKNKGGIKMDLDNIKTKKIEYKRKSDGKKINLLIARIPVKRNGQRKAEIREYVYNRGFFQRYQPEQRE